MIDLNDFTDNPKEKYLHSSGHAQLGQGEQIGATSGQTFQQRLQKIYETDKTIGNYRTSRVGAQHAALRAKQSTPETARLRRELPDGSTPSRQAFNAKDRNTPQISRPTGFKEPPSRGYNPYA